MLLPALHLCHSTCNLVERLVPPRRLQQEPIIRPEYPWEAKGVYFQGSVLKDGATFRMWYSAIGAQRRAEQYLAYAESADGVHFEKVLRPEWAHAGWATTNILYGQRFNVSAPNVHFYHEARGAYRFFLVFDSRIEQHEFQYVPKHGGLHPADKLRLMRHPNYTPDFDWSKYYPNVNQTYRAVYLADSVDGLRWEPPDARFGIPGMSDGDHTVVWDPLRRCYRMYFRANRLDENGRRIRQVVTATSTDTLEWSSPQVCLESDAIDDPRVHQIHGMTVTWHDGLFIGLIQMMEIQDEIVTWNPLTPFELARFHVQLAVSRDGVRFHRVADRAEYFGTGETGCFDCGMVRSGGQWVFDGDRMLMYYDGRPYPHGQRDPANPHRLLGDGCTGQVGIGVAEAPRDRFAGLTPRDTARPGYLTVALLEEADALTLNCDVPAGAEITASLRYSDGCRILPYTDEDFLPIRTGGLRVPLRWRCGERLPTIAHPLHLRLCLKGQATVYALNEMRPGGCALPTPP